MTHPTAADRPPRPLPGRFAGTHPAEVHVGERGSLFLYRPRRGIVYTQAVGHLEVQLAQALRAYQHLHLEGGRQLYLFHDWWDMSGYDSAARALLTEAVVAERGLIGGIVILTHSRIVAMGVATANIATSAVGVTLASHIKREAFEKVFLERVGE